MTCAPVVLTCKVESRRQGSQDFNASRWERWDLEAELESYTVRQLEEKTWPRARTGSYTGRQPVTEAGPGNKPGVCTDH